MDKDTSQYSEKQIADYHLKRAIGMIDWRRQKIDAGTMDEKGTYFFEKEIEALEYLIANTTQNLDNKKVDYSLN